MFANSSTQKASWCWVCLHNSATPCMVFHGNEAQQGLDKRRALRSDSCLECPKGKPPRDPYVFNYSRAPILDPVKGALQRDLDVRTRFSPLAFLNLCSSDVLGLDHFNGEQRVLVTFSDQSTRSEEMFLGPLTGRSHPASPFEALK